jgi:hypothetical protein
MTYTTTPRLLQTYAAVATPSARVTPAVNGTITTSTRAPVAAFTGAGSNMRPGAMAGLVAAAGVAAALL